MKSLNMSRRKQIDDRKRLLVRYRIDEKGFVSFIDPCCDDIPAALLGVLGCSCLWSIQELFEQEKRVEKGWFPANPAKANLVGESVKHERS